MTMLLGLSSAIPIPLRAASADTSMRFPADFGTHACVIHRLGLGDRFVEHGSRALLLEEVGLTREAIAEAVRRWQDAASPCFGPPPAPNDAPAPAHALG